MTKLPPSADIPAKPVLRAAERRQDARLLAAPQLLPLVGDGPHAQTLVPLRTGVDRRAKSYRAEVKEDREKLVAARYRDWLDARAESHMRIAA